MDREKVTPPVLDTENVAGGETESLQSVGGGEGVYDVLTFQKARGARALLGGAFSPAPPE